MRDVTLSSLERLGAATAEDAIDQPFMMDEDAFRLFH